MRNQPVYLQLLEPVIDSNLKLADIKLESLDRRLLWLLEKMGYDIYQLQDNYENLSNRVREIQQRLRRSPREKVYGRRK